MVYWIWLICWGSPLGVTGQWATQVFVACQRDSLGCFPRFGASEVLTVVRKNFILGSCRSNGLDVSIYGLGWWPAQLVSYVRSCVSSFWLLVRPQTGFRKVVSFALVSSEVWVLIDLCLRSLCYLVTGFWLSLFVSFRTHFWSVGTMFRNPLLHLLSCVSHLHTYEFYLLLSPLIPPAPYKSTVSVFTAKTSKMSLSYPRLAMFHTLWSLIRSMMALKSTAIGSAELMACEWVWPINCKRLGKVGSYVLRMIRIGGSGHGLGASTGTRRVYTDHADSSAARVL